jgi:hypothetical protein
VQAQSERVRFRLGLWVFVVLAVVSLFEYAGAILAGQPMLVVLPAALLKGALIAWYFMHIKQLVDPGEAVEVAGSGGEA